MSAVKLLLLLLFVLFGALPTFAQEGTVYPQGPAGGYGPVLAPGHPVLFQVRGLPPGVHVIQWDEGDITEPGTSGLFRFEDLGIPKDSGFYYLTVGASLSDGSYAVGACDLETTPPSDSPNISYAPIIAEVKSLSVYILAALAACLIGIGVMKGGHTWIASSLSRVLKSKRA